MAKADALQALAAIEQLRTADVNKPETKKQTAARLDQLARATIKLIGSSELPESAQPIYGGLSSGGFATTMTVTMLTSKGPAGSVPAGMSNPIWDILLTRYESPTSRRRFYKLGHLLSYKMHGPGNIWPNLVPQSESGNQSFERSAERRVKNLLDQQKGVRYSVTAVYGGRSSKSQILAELAAAGDHYIDKKSAVLDAEDHVPTTFEWSYQVVFDNGKPVTDGTAESGTAVNDIRQEVGKYHIR